MIRVAPSPPSSAGEGPPGQRVHVHRSPHAGPQQRQYADGGADRVHAVGAGRDVQRGPLDGRLRIADAPEERVDPGVDEEPVPGRRPHLGQPRGVLPRVLEHPARGVLQVAAHRTRLQQPLHQLLRSQPVTVLDVRRHRHVHGPRDPRDGREHLVGRRRPVRVPEGRRHARAGRGERRNPASARTRALAASQGPGRTRGSSGSRPWCSARKRSTPVSGPVVPVVRSVIRAAPACSGPASAGTSHRSGSRR